VASDVRHHVFLVVKEALTNVVRHSGARTVRFQVAIAGDVLRVTIADDGRGFDRAPDDALADGLRNMRQRMAMVGGHFELESRAGSGTRIQIELSLRQTG
jgi:signal transduction histidine kinase